MASDIENVDPHFDRENKPIEDPESDVEVDIETISVGQLTPDTSPIELAESNTNYYSIKSKTSKSKSVKRSNTTDQSTTTKKIKLTKPRTRNEIKLAESKTSTIAQLTQEDTTLGKSKTNKSILIKRLTTIGLTKEDTRIFYLTQKDTEIVPSIPSTSHQLAPEETAIIYSVQKDTEIVPSIPSTSHQLAPQKTGIAQLIKGETEFDPVIPSAGHQLISQETGIDQLVHRETTMTRTAEIVRTKKRERKGAVLISNTTIDSNMLPPSSSLVQSESNETTDECCQKFEEYRQTFRKWSVTIRKKEDSLNDGRCNCPAFSKEYICKHVVGLSIRMRYATAPLEARTVPCGEKRKRGRPSRTKPALMIQ